MMILSVPPEFTGATNAPQELHEDALWFIYKGNLLLIVHRDHGENMRTAAQIPAARNLLDLGLIPLREQYLGELAGRHCFAAEVDESTAAPAGMQWSGLRAL
ncbi:MAG: hypothetical protein GTO41_20765, partial [Burkholderiales bacterium]|nr:hypothetical protein [Burkholderiales bacterium]